MATQPDPAPDHIEPIAPPETPVTPEPPVTPTPVEAPPQQPNEIEPPQRDTIVPDRAPLENQPSAPS